MKTLNEIHAAMARTLMRHAALMYREAISPHFTLNWNYRCRLGVESLLFAISQRNDALSWEAEAANEKKLKKSEKDVDRPTPTRYDAQQDEPRIRQAQPNSPCAKSFGSSG